MLLATSYPILSVFWTMLEFFFLFLWIFLVISVFFDIFRSEDLGGGAKMLWVIFVIVLPFLGHATIVKTLRLLILPFTALFAILLGFSVSHAHLNAVAHGAGWQTYMGGLAFTIILSGLGWTECGNDFSRYLPPDSSKKAIVGWVFLGTAVPEILVMTLGAVVGTFLTSVGTSANAFLPLAHQSDIPAWFVVVFLLFAMAQLFAINSLDLYSSGVTLQALGVRVKRYQAVIIDSVICLGVTIYAIFDSSFGTYLKDFVDVVIIWIAPWVAIYLVDWGIRRWRYVPSELQRVDRGSLYWGKGGVHWPAIVAQLVGMVASMAATISSTSRSLSLPAAVDEPKTPAVPVMCQPAS